MKQLWEPLRRADRSAMATVIIGLLLLVVYLYQGHHGFFERHFYGGVPGDPYADWKAHGYQFLAALLLLFAVPVLWTRFARQAPSSRLGLALGDWRFGLKFVGIALPLVTLLLYLGAGSAEIQAEYPLARMAGSSLSLFVLWELCYGVYYISWELFFRGFWQIELSRGLGVVAALALQTAASTLVHIGKPQPEMLLAVVGGIVLGLVAVRTRSVLYGFLLHWWVGIATDLFSILRSG